ncbi:hypothetical protein [Streptomyces sp. NPDC048442]|uniref:hypothetical protein n=1 Tax=Streptomyces sp. NPDC048442 TaxID=3154823 RepID=UPI003416A704
MKDDDTENDLRRRLHGAAHTHRPDRERMLARVERGMAESRVPGARGMAESRAPGSRRTGGSRAPRTRTADAPRPPMSWLRVVTTTAAVAGVCAVVGYGAASVLRTGEQDPQSVAVGSRPDDLLQTPGPRGTGVPDTPADGPSATSGGSRPTGPATHRTVMPPHTVPPAPRTAKPPAPDRPGKPKSVPVAELLWADGSIAPGDNPHWGQSNITLRTKKPLTALTVELRVAQNGGVTDTGHWRTLPPEDFTVSVGEQGGFVVFRWTLKAGRTVPTGQHVFAGQYQHAKGERDANGDTYTVIAGTPEGQADWKGDFAPTGG